ncbi:MAG: diacylglycerol kinase family lipid kinase [Chloroflexi bacterium]|nr:diacylglycerol kinase family lipid kinase [Chloroflexota bacterium]
MSNALIVYNPAAGRFPSRMLTERAAEVLRAQGWQIHLEETHGGLHITALARQAVQQNLDAFFIAGGDGSLNYAVSGLWGSDTALGVLPAGTANVWAKELGLPDLSWTRWMALEESARRLGTASVREVDIGLCNGHPFLLWSGVGLDAFVVHRIEPRGRWEKNFAVAQYATTTLRQASLMGGIDLRIHTDGEEVSGHFLLAVASNIHLYAGGIAEISPYARLDDGEMDLWLFAGDTWLEAITHAWDLLYGRHLESDRVRCIPFRQIALSSDSTLYIQMDGEPMGSSAEVNIEVRSRALRILVPDNAPRTLFSDVT